MIGYTATELVGSPISQLWQPVHRGVVSTFERKLKMAQPSEEFEAVMVAEDGTSLELSLTGGPI